MWNYISCNLDYYLKGNGKGDKKYSNRFKIIFYSVIEYISFIKEDGIYFNNHNRPYDEVALRRKYNNVRGRIK